MPFIIPTGLRGNGARFGRWAKLVRSAARSLNLSTGCWAVWERSESFIQSLKPDGLYFPLPSMPWG
ncbi:MAG: hypothetical protein KME14_11645 [Tildeniella torsiva UHER 1998/13D]|nr:hypothetical protein [Tildeniella torsiva UHER 1998/13D]